MKTLGELCIEYEGKVLEGIPSPYPSLNQWWRGFVPGELVILAARPSMGKTSMAIDMAVSLGFDGVPVDVFSLESSEFEILSRLSASLTKDQMASLPVRICDQSFLRPTDIVTNIGDDIPDVIIVDYLQLMYSDEGNTGNNNTDIGNISKRLKAIAKDLNCTVVALSQLSRSLEHREDKRPRLSDLRDSGQIEQDADTVIMLYSPDIYRTIPRNDGITEVIIAKQRNGPANKTVRLYFDKERFQFKELEM